MKMSKLIGLVAAGVLTSLTARADVTLPKILSSHMVLQRHLPLHFWGWADPGEKVSVTFHDATASTTADSLGKWSLYLPPQGAGGPFQATITGKNTITLDDILVGDVWFASGQSNMEMPLMGFPNSAEIKNSAQEISQASHPNIRLLLVKKNATAYPLQDFKDPVAWTTCTPETAAHFSAVAYFFGREIAEKEHVPVGLIDSTWGGTPAESWVSMDSLTASAGFMPVYAEYSQMADEQSDVEALRAADKRADAAAAAAHQPPPNHPWRPDPVSWVPSWLYNAMVAPAINFPIKGVVWYQGESNASPKRAPMYEKVFSELIKDWRRQWAQGSFPFLFVQISSYKAGNDWGVVRDAQRRTLEIANTGMAVTTDVGNPDNVHPADKQTVGARLALAGRALAYGEDLEYFGPMFREATPEAGALRVWFDHAQGLNSKTPNIPSFEIAGQDHKFVAASARVDGLTVLVTAPEVPDPKYVRYAWTGATVVNLYNNAGLPASTFTSER